jgi:putative hemolysin
MKRFFWLTTHTLLLFLQFYQTVSIQAQTLLSDRTAYYPRVIQLQNDNLTPKRLLASFDNGNTGVFYESLDNGLTWSNNPVGSVTENTLPRNCCSGFYEVPQNLGSTTAGTLFWATSVGTDQSPRTACSIRIYKSIDKGRNWVYFSTAVSGTTGLWEPEFSVDNQGRLVMYFSSEEYKSSGYNQLLAHRISTDGGATWSADVIDVGVNDGGKRPGMAIVRKLPNNSYVMIYEVCGFGNCDVFIRTSTNGYDWGTASNLGVRVESSNNNHFAHAPNLAWANDGTANGKLVVVGQTLYDVNGNFSGNNGKVLMTNSNNGVGTWTEIAAPVESPNNGSTPCPNYSSALLPSVNGQNVLELALKDTPNGCRLYYGTGSLTATVGSGTTLNNGVYRLVNKNSGKVLEVAGSSATAGTKVQQYAWNGTDAQRWKIEITPDGYYKLTAQHSGQVLDVDACSAANGAKVQQYTSFNNDCQKWRLETVGDGYYRIVNKNSSKVLDVDACSTADEGKVQQYDWLGGDCQRWKLEAVSPNFIANNTYRLTVKHSGQALEVDACSSADGAKVQQYTWLNNNCQRWNIQATTDGYYRLTSVNSGKVLDVDACSAANGAKVQQYASFNNDCQKWGFEAMGSGYYRIINKNSGKVLDVDACSQTVGIKVQQWEWLGGDCQRWKPEVVSAAARLDAPSAADVQSPQLNVYPNPAGSDVTISYVLDESGPINLSLYNSKGQLIQSMFQGEGTIGAKQFYSLKGTDLPNGIYFLKLASETKLMHQKLIVIH